MQRLHLTSDALATLVVKRGHEDIETGPPDPLATVAVGGFTPLSHPSSSLFPGLGKVTVIG